MNPMDYTDKRLALYEEEMDKRIDEIEMKMNFAIDRIVKIETDLAALRERVYCP